MNKYLIIGLAVIILIGGFTFFANNNSTKKQEVSITGNSDPLITSVQQDSSISTPQNQATDSSSSYIEYSRTELDKAKNNRRVLFFYASWCPTCRIADPDFRENVGSFPDDLSLIRVNYNDPDTDQEEKDLAKKYAITYQHTFVQIDSQGNEIAKWNGGKTEELLANIK